MHQLMHSGLREAMKSPRSGRLGRVAFTVTVVSALRLAKERFTYRELSTATGIPAPQIARYVSGSSLPSSEKAERILRGLWKLADPRRALAERLAETGGVLDTSVVLTDPLYLTLASLYYLERLRDIEPTRILVPEASGIPLATSLSLLLGAPFTVARRYMGYGLCSSSEPRFCIRPGQLGRSDRVLIVDDIVETGMTLRALEEIADSIGARVEAVAALVVVGDEWRRHTRIARIEAMVYLKKPGMRREPGL
ncbi:phosphoribosyltransferase family protein [Hyperthermus butylicus]|nr:phosphoribosyltransferase family protein [Hyperthermus butylicus]